MTTQAVLPATAQTVTEKRPVTATVAAFAQLVFGSVTSIAGVAFSIAEGGGWAIAGAPLFVVALAGWWAGGLGLLRGSARGYRIGCVMLLAEVAFGIYKIAWVHESAAYLFQSLTIVMIALQLAPSTRRWAARG
jgi:hypothetical protein